MDYLPSLPCPSVRILPLLQGLAQMPEVSFLHPFALFVYTLCLCDTWGSSTLHCCHLPCLGTVLFWGDIEIVFCYGAYIAGSMQMVNKETNTQNTSH